jgi:hypothetical protein
VALIGRVYPVENIMEQPKGKTYLFQKSSPIMESAIIFDV